MPSMRRTKRNEAFLRRMLAFTSATSRVSRAGGVSKRAYRAARQPRQRTGRLTTIPSTDVILAMKEPYMQQIVTGQKTYEFRRYLLKESVQRVWFYRTAPHSSLDYVCEIAPARMRGEGQTPLEEDGLGNTEFNTGHPDWEGYDFAYKILSVYKLKTPLTLSSLKRDYGMKSAPRGWMYTPDLILQGVPQSAWEKVL